MPTLRSEMDADAVREETVIYQNPLLPLKIWEIHASPPEAGPIVPGSWHYHKEAELLALTEGTMDIQTKEDHYRMTEGDVVLLGSSQLHRTHRTDAEPLRFIVCQIDLSRHFDRSTLPYLHALTDPERPLDRLNYMFQQFPKMRQEAFRLIRDMHEESLSRQRGYELAIGSSIQRLLWLFVRHDERGVLDTFDHAGVARLRPVLEHVERHLREPISVGDASRMLNFSYHYFIRLFRAAMGCSFIDYVNRKRIREAERLLLTGDRSIAEIVAESGVPSTAQFYKLFKRFNRCSPKEFRARMREPGDPAEPDFS